MVLWTTLVYYVIPVPNNTGTGTSGSGCCTRFVFFLCDRTHVVRWQCGDGALRLLHKICFFFVQQDPCDAVAVWSTSKYKYANKYYCVNTGSTSTYVCLHVVCWSKIVQIREHVLLC